MEQTRGIFAGSGSSNGRCATTAPQRLYEEIYCTRGDMKAGIKQQSEVFGRPQCRDLFSCRSNGWRAKSSPRSFGEVPERSNGAVSKTVVPLAGDRGFESLPLRQMLRRSVLERSFVDPTEPVAMKHRL